MSTIKVGDPVRVYLNTRHDQGEVVKVGRILATIQVGNRTYEFRLDTQRFTGRQVGSGTYFRTMEQVALEERRASAENALHRIGLQFTASGHRDRLTLEQIEALAEVAKSTTTDPEI